MMTNPHDEREQAAIDKIAALIERSSLGTPAARAARNRTPLSRGQRIADMKTNASDAANDLLQVTTADYQSVQASAGGHEQPNTRRGLTPSRTRTNRIILLPADVLTIRTKADTDQRPVVASEYRSLFTTATGREVTPWRIRRVAALDAVNTITAQHRMIQSATSRHYKIAKTSLVNRLQSTTESLRSRWETRRIHHGARYNRSIVVFIAGQGGSSSLLLDHLLPAFDDGGRRRASWWTAMSTGVDPSAGLSDDKTLSTRPGILQAFVVYASPTGEDSGWCSPWHDIYADFLDETGHDVRWAPLVREQWGTVWKSIGVHILGSAGIAEFVMPWVVTTSGGDGWFLAGDDSLGVMRAAHWPLIIPSTLATTDANCLDIKRVSLAGERRAFSFRSRSDGLIDQTMYGRNIAAVVLRDDAQSVATGRTLQHYLRLLNAECTRSTWMACMEAVLDGVTEVSGILVSQLGDMIKGSPVNGARQGFLDSGHGDEVLSPPPAGSFKPLSLDPDRTDTPLISKKLTS